MLLGILLGSTIKHYRPWFGNYYYSHLNYYINLIKKNKKIIKNNQKNNLDIIIIEGNSFDIEVKATNLVFNDRVASAYAKKNNSGTSFEIFTHEGLKITNEENIKLQLPQEFYLGSGTGGLKNIFLINNVHFGLITAHFPGCVTLMIYRFTDNKEILRGDCLPDYNEIDYNGFGAASINYKGQTLISIGTPTTTSNNIDNLSQNDKSIYGKIISINNELISQNIINNNFTIFSKGHRNPQGLVLINNQIISTEHGPRGGDEINLIKKDKNYGWPVVSYGTRYLNDKNGKSYKTNHAKNNFEEPIFSFVPSIGISDISKCPKNLINYYENSNCLLVLSLREQSIFVILLDENYKKIIFSEKHIVSKRLRKFVRNPSHELFEENDNSFYASEDFSGIYKFNFINFR